MKKLSVKEFRNELKFIGYKLEKSNSYYRIIPVDKHCLVITGFVLTQLIPKYGFYLQGVCVVNDSDSSYMYALINR